MQVDLLLVRCRVERPEDVHAAAERFCAEAGLRLERAAGGGEGGWAYVYGAPLAASAWDVARLAQQWQALCPQAREADVSRLQRVQDHAGASADAVPARHYVVETDPEAGWTAELERWYVEEHMPGLAAVPGCVRAQRFVNHDAGPRSHACYGLVTEETLGSPPWLAVRGTAWSSRVRPHFTNTRRTMMRVLG